ncbi:RNA polymerase sigma factor [Dyadobacter aurulentus]|uniref:RNA polymerase sigma factor n=1 Tax=Dyadobacter sp. UC 10 TaxID=2605428 RepID=UPI001CED49F7|nr:sigma-70 family RNA polymerase sigma factor [Dyadobacter sp. UC 10]
MTPVQSDSQLWNRFRQGDRDAFRQIYQLFAGDLLNYGYKVCGDIQLIEDSVHDLFVEIWQRRDHLSETDSIRFYLFRALRNKISTSQRKNSHYDSFETLESSADEFLIEQHLIDEEQRDGLLRQLRTSYGFLSQRQQQALHMRFFLHLSNEEIAELMGINYQSACKFIYSGLKALRETVRIISLLLPCLCYHF